mmetsp:Transcript_6509/g.12144  ORF Transcript_6509/g.12144 Transcript_6509/m.12144 type:complete len:138 (-) Transcript_6509:364-777(-)
MSSLRHLFLLYFLNLHPEQRANTPVFCSVWGRVITSLTSAATVPLTAVPPPPPPLKLHPVAVEAFGGWGRAESTLLVLMLLLLVLVPGTRSTISSRAAGGRFEARGSSTDGAPTDHGKEEAEDDEEDANDEDGKAVR